MVVGVVLVALLGLSLSPAVPALRQSNERTPVYVIHNVFDAETRSAIAATGALIIEVGKDYVLVEATPKEKRAIEALGLFPSEPVGPDVSILAFPAAGVSWTATKSTATLTTNNATYILGGPADNWGFAWTLSELSDTNFRVRVIDVSSSTSRDFSLDWVAVRVSY